MLFHDPPATSFTTGTDTKCGSADMFSSLRNIRGRMEITKGSFGFPKHPLTFQNYQRLPSLFRTV